ncbi:MAG: hypothetical protein JW959_09150 [Pirellulales bacterium]|nr:hypothetical protein [Pirellulales bacterium]
MAPRVDRRMFDSSTGSFFPLPLTAFEKYMLLDDRPGHPMVFPLRLRFSGEISRPIFESSFEEALSRHPLLCSLAKRSPRRGPVWVLAEELRPAIDWGPPGAVVGSPRGEKINLDSEVGLRAWVRQEDGAAEVTFQFHHACCDAGGALRFVGHLLSAYGMRMPSVDQRPTPWPADTACLLGRGRFVADAAIGKGSGTRAVWAGLRDAARWVGRRPATLCSNALPAGNKAAAIPFLETFRHVFEESETTKLLRAAARQRATVNDLLLRDMFLILRRWNAEWAPGAADRWLRVLTPVKMKTGDDDRMPAANGVSYNFFTRRESQCVDRPVFLQGISRENDPATRHRRGMSFLRGFRLLELIPGAVPLMARTNRCFATTVLSNLGDVGRYFGTILPCRSGKIAAGNLVLEDVFGAPPVRPNTRAVFAVGTYGGRMWVSVRRDPRALTADGVRGLLEMYVNRLRKSADLLAAAE